MANYKVKTQVTEYDTNYPYSGANSSMDLVVLSHQKFYYNTTDNTVYVQEVDMPKTVTVTGEYYPSTGTDAVIVSRYTKGCFYIKTSQGPFEIQGGSQVTITISPDAVPDGYTQFVRQSRIEGYASTESVEQS